MKIEKERLFLQNATNEDSKIGRLTNVAFAANGFQSIENKNAHGIYWNEQFFNLTTSPLWKNLNQTQKTNILKRMSDHLLREAYYIENAGMLYAAKMNVMAESQEERAFFSIMGFEEAKHLQSLNEYFTADIKGGCVPSFSQHIGKIITEGDKTSNLFLIQILLEGWGLTYYQSLADQTVDSGMKEVFGRILKDETRHHSAGVILLEQKQTGQNSFLIDAFYELIEMVRIGPWTLVQEIKNELGDLASNNIRSLLVDLNAVEDTNKKLARLRDLTEKSLGDDLLRKFQSNKCWNAYSIEDMLKAHL
jgi:rubrerythrin